MNFLFFPFFFINTPRELLSSHAVDSHRMFSGGSVVGTDCVSVSVSVGFVYHYLYFCTALCSYFVAICAL